MVTNVTLESIREIINGVDPINASAFELDPEESLAGQGIDSLEMMSIFLGIEEKFDIKIPDEDTDKLDSIASIMEYLNGSPD
jgi:acyl carrier protein